MMTLGVVEVPTTNAVRVVMLEYPGLEAEAKTVYVPVGVPDPSGTWAWNVPAESVCVLFVCKSSVPVGVST